MLRALQNLINTSEKYNILRIGINVRQKFLFDKKIPKKISHFFIFYTKNL